MGPFWSQYWSANSFNNIMYLHNKCIVHTLLLTDGLKTYVCVKASGSITFWKFKVAFLDPIIAYLTVTIVCPVIWPMNGNEGGTDLVLIQTPQSVFPIYTVNHVRCSYPWWKASQDLWGSLKILKDLLKILKDEDLSKIFEGSLKNPQRSSNAKTTCKDPWGHSEDLVRILERS